MTLKEYLARIDVAMGGRVAEELSELLISFASVVLSSSNPVVYGADGLTSGASSDIRAATQTADAMVKVSLSLWVLLGKHLT